MGRSVHFFIQEGFAHAADPPFRDLVLSSVVCRTLRTSLKKGKHKINGTEKIKMAFRLEHSLKMASTPNKLTRDLGHIVWDIPQKSKS